MSDQIEDLNEDLKSEELSTSDRPLAIPAELPVLPLRDTVLFPNSFMPLAVARESSVHQIDDAIAMRRTVQASVVTRNLWVVKQHRVIGQSPQGDDRRA